MEQNFQENMESLSHTAETSTVDYNQVLAQVCGLGLLQCIYAPH
jgi:hypothetical protein